MLSAERGAGESEGGRCPGRATPALSDGGIGNLALRRKIVADGVQAIFFQVTDSSLRVSGLFPGVVGNVVSTGDVQIDATIELVSLHARIACWAFMLRGSGSGWYGRLSALAF